MKQNKQLGENNYKQNSNTANMKYTATLSLIALCATSAYGIALPEPLPQGSPGIEYWNFTCTAPQTGGCCLYQWGSVPVSYTCKSILTWDKALSTNVIQAEKRL